MPKGPTGEQRPADVNAKIATGDIEDVTTAERVRERQR
jgi:hypothetical protein